MRAHARARKRAIGPTEVSMPEKVEGAYGAEQIQVLDGLEHIRKRPVCISAPRTRGGCIIS